MSASDLYKEGKLADAVAAQIAEVKSNPADQARRLFLFEMLAFSGELDRARKQIDVLKFDDLALESAVASYRQLLEAEQQRRDLFAKGRAPQFLGEPTIPMVMRLDAVRFLRENNPGEAAALLRRAGEAAPPLHGTMNGKAFQDVRDCDDLFGDVLEVMAKGTYFWVPLEQVEMLSLTPPKFPRDLIWKPARLEMREGAAGDVFLPALYLGSHEHAADEVKLGRRTDFSETEPIRGLGAKLFLVGDGALPLLEWRELRLEAPTEASPERVTV